MRSVFRWERTLGGENFYNSFKKLVFKSSFDTTLQSLSE